MDKMKRSETLRASDRKNDAPNVTGRPEREESKARSDPAIHVSSFAMASSLNNREYREVEMSQNWLYIMTTGSRRWRTGSRCTENI